MENIVNVAVVPVLVGLLEVIKMTGVDVKLIPAISVLLGLLLGVGLHGLSINGVLVGVSYGLSACGLYSGVKATME